VTALPFSVLLPVYAGDRPDYLARSLVSIMDEQTRPPDEVVIVRDGPVGPELEQTLADAASRARVPVVRVDLQHNEGLGRALDRGLAECRYDVVARQDADDISLPERFERQLPLIKDGADLVGAGLLEFGEDEHDILGQRTPPTSRAEIHRSARFRDPFNHPTVVYRRAAVAAVGGYAHLPLMEDYWLFVRMLESGAVADNLAEPLVLYRVGAGAYARRGGRELLRSELDLQRRMRAAGYLTRTQYARNVAVRGGYRLVPEGVRQRAYRRFFTARHAS
jgi:glycosyltransferase involved in cell wall biosynthesis